CQARCRCRLSCAFFFRAEDGIRDRNVTGVQTCALPIFGREPGPEQVAADGQTQRPVLALVRGQRVRVRHELRQLPARFRHLAVRSEERRVAKASPSSRARSEAKYRSHARTISACPRTTV